MRVALIQLNAGPDKSDNLRRTCQWVAQAASRKARFILLPEVFNLRIKSTKDNIYNFAESIPGESSKPFLDLARKLNIYILLGSFLTQPKKILNGKVYNTSILINPKGKIAAAYNKIHLFDAVIGPKAVKESAKMLAGKKKVLARVDQFKLGMTVCYDLRFPGLYSYYANHGAHILTVPSSFTHKTGQAHWESLLRARAIENLCYVLAPNQIGRDSNGILSYGHSMIISPWGEVLAEASESKEEIICADIFLDEIKRCRQILPSIRETVF